MLFGHGFGSSQESWRLVAPAFEDDYRVIVFDHVGAGGSDSSAYDRGKYDSLHGYTDDLIEIIEQLDLHDVVFVGHCVSAMIGVLAANRIPERFSRLVLVDPSPRYVDDEGYEGGFTASGIESLLDSLDSNYLGWSSRMGPALMGNADRPQLGADFAAGFSTVDPEIAGQFARATFLSDHRRDLADVTVPTLVMQSTDDVLAPPSVGAFVHASIPGSEYVEMTTRGHVPNLSDPTQVIAHIRSYLR
jgi:sigma-B regulation protein RsbQ